MEAQSLQREIDSRRLTFTKMPKVRLLGNIGLSFLTKLSTGYWELFDPTNGFLAIHQDVFNKISLNKNRQSLFL